MSAPAHERLSWKSEWGHQTAEDGRCFYIRESAGSIIAAFIFCVIISGSSIWLGVSIFMGKYTLMEKAFGSFTFVIAGLFIWVLVSSLRRGRWMVVYDRGEPGVPGEIRTNRMRLPVDRVRGFSTRSVGGNPPKSTVVAELHDGTYESLGPVGVSTWPAHYAHRAAVWMGLPYRPGT